MPRLPKAELLVVVGLIVVAAVAAVLIQVGASGWGSDVPLWGAPCPHCEAAAGQLSFTYGRGQFGHYTCRACDRSFTFPSSIEPEELR